MSECARYAPMIGARQGELDPAERAALADHLSACPVCQGRLADERALQGLVGEALLRAAARRDFSDFADQVMARVERRRVRPLRTFVRRHRALAVATALAPTLAAAALIVYLDLRRAGAQPGIEVVSEQYAPMVIESEDGPVILLGDDEPEGS